MKKLLLYLAIFVSSTSYGQEMQIDPTFNVGTGFSSGFATGITCAVYAIEQQPDGKTIVGGIFTSYNGTPVNNLVRLNSDGTIDASFNIGSGFTPATIKTIILQPDGKILVHGSFSEYNGTSDDKGLIRLNQDGSIDNSFDLGNTYVRYYAHILLQPDGKIFYCNEYNQYAPSVVNFRLNTDGSIDNSYIGSGLTYGTYAVVLAKDGKFVVLTGKRKIVRLNSDGTLDNSFNMPGLGSGFDRDINCIEVQDDGKVLVGGQFTKYNGVSRYDFARLNADGSLDPDFVADYLMGRSTTYPQMLRVGPNKMVYAQGTGLFYRMFPDGNIDNSMRMIGQEIGKLHDVHFQSDGKIVIAGEFEGGIDRFRPMSKGNTSIPLSTHHSKVNIYPNPSSGDITILLTESPQNATINVTDVTGKVVLHSKLENKASTIQLDCPDGMYFVTISTGTTVMTEKIILQKK